MTTHRFGFALTAAALVAFGVSGCATKNYVRNQTAPLVEHTGKLDNEAAQNNRQIQDVNSRAQAGITQAQNTADTANQNAQNASTEAGTAQSAANDAVHRADSLDSVVEGLDNYKQEADVSVHFAFNKAVLTDADRSQLDSFAAQLTSAQNFILEVTGGCDSTGPVQYNYDLSQRRADAVVQYLASKYNIAPRRLLPDRHRQVGGGGFKRHRERATGEPARRGADADEYASGVGTIEPGVSDNGRGSVTGSVAVTGAGAKLAAAIKRSVARGFIAHARGQLHMRRGCPCHS